MGIIDMESWVIAKANEVNTYIVKHGIPTSDAIDILYPGLTIDTKLKIVNAMPVSITPRLNRITESLKRIDDLLKESRKLNEGVKNEERT